MILFDIDACTRGLCGSKKTFDIDLLPSIKKRKSENKLEENKEETEEERLERHERFFEGLKSLVKGNEK